MTRTEKFTTGDRMERTVSWGTSGSTFVDFAPGGVHERCPQLTRPLHLPDLGRDSHAAATRLAACAAEIRMSTGDGRDGADVAFRALTATNNSLRIAPGVGVVICTAHGSCRSRLVAPDAA